ncbi:MAG: sensor histidine kinase [Rhodobacterales bacterium]
MRKLLRAPDRLGVRLALLLSVALLPVGLIAVLQSVSLLKEAEARSEAALMGETLMIVQSELQVLQRAQGMAVVIAEHLARRAREGEAQASGVDGPPDLGRLTDICDRGVGLLNSQISQHANLAVVGADGNLICAPNIARANLIGTELLQQLVDTTDPSVHLDSEGVLASGSAILVTHPIQVPQAGLDDVVTIGVVTIVLPHVALDEISGMAMRRMPLSLPSDQGSAILTFNVKGEVLTSSLGMEGASYLLPRHRSLSALTGGQTLAFTARSASGTERVYSVVPLIDGTLYALGTWPGEGHRIGALDAMPAAIFPALMWGASLLVAWLAAGQMVTRHIYRLRGAIGAFAGGDRAVRKINVDGAPLELRELSDSFMRMTDTILHDEAELENAIHQKEVLLREVHHRVKNNLQLIASILNMQLRQARTPEAKILMKGVRDRVLGLATIHHGLYQTSGLTDVSAHELLSDILRQLTRMATGPGRRLIIEEDFDPISLTPDQAVPLSLFLTEALTNAIKYAGQDGDKPPLLSVSLKRKDDNSALLCVVNSTGAKPESEADLPEGTGLGVQLLDSFAQQIGGTLTREESENRFALALGFRLSALTDAEARNAPDAPPDTDLEQTCLEDET